MSDKIIFCVADEQFLPEKQTPGAACRDLRVTETTTIEPNTIQLAGTGLKIYLPTGRHTKLYARSGLPLKTGLMLGNSVAIIDADYRGEYFVQLYNFTANPITVEAGTRVAQLELARTRLPGETHTVNVPELEVITDATAYANFAELYPSQRGEGGFNSTGLK